MSVRSNHASAALRVALVVSGLTLGSGVARAQDATQQAAREFTDGQKAFGANEFRKAAELFEAAYQHKPHHAALYNGARARQKAGDSARAANLYLRYLREAPSDARDRNTATTSLHNLATKLGQLDVHAVGLDELKVDQEPATEGTVYVDPGAHVIEASKDGKAVQKKPSVEAGETVSVTLVAPDGKAGGTDDDNDNTDKPKKTTASTGGWSPTVVIVGAGLTVVGATLTIFSGIDVLSQKAAFELQQTQANLEAGKAKELRTNILLGVTIGIGVLTGVAAIWLVDWHGGSTSTDPAVQVGFGPGSIHARGSF